VKPVTPEALQMAVQRSLSTRALLAENTALRTHLNLFETCQRITSLLEREKLVPLALAALASECLAPAAALVERDDTGSWRVTGTLGFSAGGEESLREGALPRLEDVTLQGAVTLELPSQRGLPGSRCLALPVGDGERVLAAACVFVPHDLDFERTGRAAFICRHVGMALRTLGRLSHVEHLAYVDDVTRLYNSRFLDVAIDREIQGGRAFTVLFMDLDRFKGVNDKHGHLMGSHVLTEFARVLRACTRDEDVLIRYGGDEFVAVLTGVDSGGGLKIAERIRRAVEDHRFLSREGLSVRLTVSIGLASYPEHARAKTAILDLADRAMYRGKETTRNVVYIASADLPPLAGPG
jgi:diguanylate cyclase (GGDEF)-like protein